MENLHRGYCFLRELERQKGINSKDSQVAAISEEPFSKIDEMGVELIDEEKIARETEAVNQKYADDFKARRVGGIGTGAPGDFFFVTGIVVINIAQWAIAHIFQDTDDWLWKKVKGAFIAIYEKAKTLRSSDRIVLKESPNIIFVFPLDLDLDTVNKELDELAKITKKLLADESSKSIQYKYTYNSNRKTWELETSKRGPY